MKNISIKKLAIIITAAVVALVLLVLGIITTVDYVKNDKGFDYLKSDLSKYIEFSDEYKGFDLNVDIAEPRDIDIKITILNMLRDDKPKEAWLSGTANCVINPGDVVYIWYRGYLIGEDGEPVEYDGMCNFDDKEPHALEIGSNGFVPGFELGLLGKYTGETAKFDKITVGKVTEGNIAYITYTKTVYKEDGTTTDTKTVVDSDNPKRIILSDSTVDETYGAGFVEKISSLNIGAKADFEVEINGKKVKYTDLKVDFVTDCETPAEGEKTPYLIDCYFPYDYGAAELRNMDARFEVYIEKADFYYEDTPEFNDEYLKKKIEDKEIAVTLEKLDEYEGDTLVDKYMAYAEELMQKLYEAEYNSLVEKAIWEYYGKIAKVKKYPTAKVDEVYYDYAIELQNIYYANGGRIQNSYGYYDTYDNLNDYANAYLGINSSSEYYYLGKEAWKYSVYDMAEEYVKERLILYYVLRADGSLPSKEAIAEEVEIIKQEYLDEYVDQYLENEDKTKEDYPGEKWDEFMKEREKEIFSYYDDAHFEERAYYSLASDIIVKWPNVITLEERSNFPQDK